MEEQKLELESGTLVYQIGGRGPLVVLYHAFDLAAWGSVEALRCSCTVAIPQWERSALPIDAKMGFDWFESLVHALGLEQGALCAWSMAGPAAAYFAAEGSPCLSHLILVDIAGLSHSFPRLRLRDLPHVVLTRVLGRPTRGFVRVLFRDWIRSRSVDTKPLVDAMVRFLRSDAADWSPDDDNDDHHHEDGDEALGSLEDVFAKIASPTLVVTGRHSSVLGPEVARAAVDLMPNGKLIVLDGSSHAPQIENPEEFQAAVAAFLAQ